MGHVDHNFTPQVRDGKAQENWMAKQISPNLTGRVWDWAEIVALLDEVEAIVSARSRAGAWPEARWGRFRNR